MNKRSSKTYTCKVCNKEKNFKELLPGNLVRAALQEKIKEKFPDWSSEDYICFTDLNLYRNEYIKSVLEKDKGDITSLDQEVIRSFKEYELISENIENDIDENISFGEKLADKVAVFGGSWHFLILFFVFLFSWIIINSIFLIKNPVDPFPYILLNLFLSCLASLQAPIIMMSQNRQEKKDRIRSYSDYKTNLKAELEIRMLNEKVDLLIKHQWQRLLEIQEIQMDLIQEISNGNVINQDKKTV